VVQLPSSDVYSAFVIAIVLGLVAGGVMFELDVQTKWMSCYATDSSDEPQSCFVEIVELPGKLWIRALKCIVAPLIASMMLLIPSKLQSLGAIGQRVAMLLLFTSMVAAVEGLMWGSMIRPGRWFIENKEGIAEPGPRKNFVSEMEAFLNISYKFVPSNIFVDLAELQVLGIITFFLSFGIFLEKDVPNQWKAPILNSARGFLRASLNCLMLVMWCMPIAMFSILAYNMLKTNLDSILGATTAYLLTQLLAQFVHLGGFYFLFFFLTTRRNPLLFFWRIIKAPFTALLTSSSAATLPITLRENLKERGDNEFARRVCEFVLPLGSTLNMDGTSLGFPIMVLFVHQVGEEQGLFSGGMPFGDMLLVALLSMTCSLGTAPIPNAGMVYLTMLLEAANITHPGLQASGFAMIYLVDWIVDRVETAQNVTSDSFISAIIAYSPIFKVMGQNVAETQLAENGDQKL